MMIKTEQFNSPFGLWDDEPRSNGKRSPHTQVEESSLKTPVPFIGVEHVRNENIHYHTHDATEGCTETGRVSTESL